MSFRKSIIDKEVVHCDTTLLLYPFKILPLTIYNCQLYIDLVSRCVRVSVSEGTGARVEVVRVTAGAGAGDGGRGETTGTGTAAGGDTCHWHPGSGRQLAVTTPPPRPCAGACMCWTPSIPFNP